MRKTTLITLTLLLVMALTLSACNFSVPGLPNTRPPAPTAGTQATEVAQVAETAQRTATQPVIEQQADATDTLEPLPSDTPEPPPPTDTPVPPTVTLTPTITETPTLAFTATTAPTQTPLVRIPTATQTPLIQVNPPTVLATATPAPCNAARFLADVTVRDRTIFSANTPFIKTWRLKNVGTCTWNAGYDVVFVDGTRMGAPTALDLPSFVSPGQEVEVAISMVAPSVMGTYRGNWKLRDDRGVLFGVGTNAPFYVEIIVNTNATLVPTDYTYDFAANFCSAEWTNSIIVTTTTRLPCPGTDGDIRGFVMRFERPQLETDQIDDEPGLILNPQMIADGVIRGRFPAVRIAAGDHFKALVGCDYMAKSCDVKLQLDYQVGTGPVQTLGTWTETNDGRTTQIDIDLSSLAGSDVQFSLVTMANGAMVQDRALWVAPRIERVQP